jgi:hypothetical protein
MTVRLAITALLAAAALAIGASSAPARPAPARAADDACPDVIFVGARGSGEKESGETAGMGPSVFHMAQRMQHDLDDFGEEMRTLPIRYDALGVETLAPSKRQMALFGVSPAPAVALWYKHNLKRYLDGLNEGVNLFVEAVEATVAACPDTDLVAAGYSQGAMVVHQGERKLRERGDEDAVDAIVGTLLLADGDRTPKSAAKRFGTAPARGEGIRPYMHAAKGDVVDGDFTAEICNAGDLICDFKPSRLRHFNRAKHTHTKSYLSGHAALLDKAVDWINDQY